MPSVIGKYRILAHLRGGEATETSLVALEAKDSTEKRPQLGVLKRLKLGADAEPRALEQFAVEAALCKKLDHPNISKLLEAGQHAGEPVLVFEYVEGVTLARLRSRALRQEKGLPPSLALFIVREIGKGLAAAHGLKDENGKSLGLVHRDVSPENVFVTYDGDVKLTDFGMATTVQSAAKSRADRVKGNVAYMAPEQARSEYALDARADIFALGVILWELLIGKRLWEGLSEVDVLARLADDTPLPGPKSVVAELPTVIDELCSQALKKVRDERFDSVDDFLAALEKAQAKTGLDGSRQELAHFVTMMFADELIKQRTVIDEATAKPADKSGPLPAIGAPRASGADKLNDVESDPKLRFGVATPQEEPSKRVVEVVEIPVPQAASSDKRFAYAMGAAALAVVGIVTVVLLTSPPEKKNVDPGPYIAPTRPTASAAPGDSAYKEPTEITIDIRVTPPEAKLFVDGVQVTNPHRRTVVPGTFNHSIRAEAPGFETRTASALFDKERSIELALTPTPTKPGAPPGPGAPKPSASVPAKPPPSASGAGPLKMPLPMGESP